MPSVERRKHQEGVGSFREDIDFAEATLACEDGQQVEAHKVILAASSPFFRKLLVRNTHPHPLVYMRKMNSDDMMAIVDFLYNGETNVHQENLERFFAVAEELQLKGLMGKLNEKVEEFDERDAPPKEKPLVGKPAKIPKTLPYSQISSGNISEREGTVALSSYFSGALEELEERVNDGKEQKQDCKRETNGLQVQSVWKGRKRQCDKRSHRSKPFGWYCYSLRALQQNFQVQKFLQASQKTTPKQIILVKFCK